jgi:hypothetical protein
MLANNAYNIYPKERGGVFLEFEIQVLGQTKTM